MKTNIEILGKFDNIKNINEVLSSIGIVTLDLEHVPFREFTYAVELKDTDYNFEDMRKQFSYIPDDKFNDIVEQIRREKENKTRHVVTIKGKEITVQDSACRITVLFKDTVNVININAEGLGPVIEDAQCELLTSSVPESELPFVERSLLQLFSDVIQILVYMQLPKEHKQVVKCDPRTTTKANVSKKKKGKKVTYIKNVVYEPTTDPVKYQEFRESRSYTRKTESWVARGFWRKYKSGKRVWIEPQVKHAKGSKPTTTVDTTYVVS